uniref:AN1-type domain-containing protein n=1 Tax=Arcella intermedia TaxID=1963864 RepID=A0A6B2LSZ0_9EUKA|eukprot:TRINITY_DN26750_c0_g1_i1.p1 TRINITY_DN26750_c0_g1~~TRINITY_DN26750_c0_g1_i1.p1  ORF type:complete len:118 (-),score=11.65 TRINITY_DN26750_c0_g1_i1:111-464(-)
MDTQRLPEIKLDFDKKIEKNSVDSAVPEKTLDSDLKKDDKQNGEVLKKLKLPRCNLSSCNKKIGYTGYTCHCGSTFCATHRYAKEHNCTFDYKTLGRQELAKRNNNYSAGFSKITKL